MGYESRIYVVQESDYKRSGRLPYGDVIAVFDLCKMGYEIYEGSTFRELFTEERSCDFYADDGNTVIKEDFYGDEIQKADTPTVLHWLDGFCQNNDWWRARAFYNYLRNLEYEGCYPSLYHFGY